MKRYVLWGAGFAALFAGNALVELVVLPALDLENTPKNDGYFLTWWFGVGLWGVWGNAVLQR